METNDMKILAIDDNRHNLTALKAVLADRLPHARLFTALDGLKGLELARAEDPDVILLDIVMPGMDGYAVCRKLKEDGHLRSIPVVFLTALRTDQESRVKALEAGAEGFLAKPFDALELTAQIRAMIKVKAANNLQWMGREQLTSLVLERTIELEKELAERRRIEAERDRLITAIEETDESIYITDLDGNILYINSAVVRNTGYSRDEMVGQNPRIVKSGKQDEAFYRDLWATISGGKTWKGQMVNRRKDGTLYTVDKTISPVHDPAGAIVNYVAINHDITEHLRISADKARLKEELQQAQRVEAVGRLAGGVAHDFNNMLSVILGHGEMLLAKLHAEDPSREKIAAIVKAGRRSSDLTRQLLTFARRQIISLKNIDLNQTVTEFLKLIQKVTREDIEIKTILEEGLPTIRADRGQIEQVLMNICLNARDAMPEGGQMIIETKKASVNSQDVKQHPYMKVGKYVLLSVSDNGVGMGENIYKHVFEPFFTTKGPNKGTGLGLSVVFGIVKQHGGYIHLDSEPKRGTKFTIYFPTVDAPPDARSAVSSKPARGGTETLLVAEDEDSVRDLFQQTLESYGYKVLTARNGAEAVEVYLTHREEIALAVLDVVMPKKGGKEAYDEIAKITPGLKVLFLSGYSTNAIHDDFILSPGLSFLQKPFIPSVLARKVREILDTK